MEEAAARDRGVIGSAGPLALCRWRAQHGDAFVAGGAPVRRADSDRSQSVGEVMLTGARLQPLHDDQARAAARAGRVDGQVSPQEVRGPDADGSNAGAYAVEQHVRSGRLRRFAPLCVDANVISAVLEMSRKAALAPGPAGRSRAPACPLAPGRQRTDKSHAGLRRSCDET